MASGWKFSWRGVPVSQHHQFRFMWSSVSFLFYPYISCPPLHNSVGYGLTVLWSCWITILDLEKRECHWWTPHPKTHLLRRTRVVYSLAPFLTKASLRLPCIFSSYIYNAHSSYFSLFHLCWLLRETKRETVACYFVVLSFCQQIFRHLTLRQHSDLQSLF